MSDCRLMMMMIFCRYGVGYHLTLVKKESYDQEAITSLIKRHVPTAEIISCVGAEIQFVLSSESSQSFEALFYELESKYIVTASDLCLYTGAHESSVPKK